MRTKKTAQKKVVAVKSDGESSESETEAKTTRTSKRTGGIKNDDKTEDVEKETAIPPSSSTVRKIFLTHRDIGAKGWKNIESASLPHPRTGDEAMFLLDTRLTEVGKETFFIFEVLTMAQPTRSWFVDDSVVSDGNLYVSSPLDPLFLVLPILAKSTQAKPLVDHLTDYMPAKVVDILCKRIPSKQLEYISVKKVFDDIEAYAYSEEASLSWLSKKVKKTSEFLRLNNISSSEASVSSNFSKSSSELSKEDDAEFLRYACDIVGEYMEETLRKKLLTSLGLPAETERSKRKNNDSAAEEGQNKKVKVTDNVQPLEDYGSSVSANAAASNKDSKGKSKQKEFQKAAQGTHSLLKFFTPRSK